MLTRKKLAFSLAALLLAVLSALLFGTRLGDGVLTTLNLRAPHKYVILIHIDEKKLFLLDNGECVRQYTIATGKPGFSSPVGDWKIANKGRDPGDGMGARWMGLNVPWGNYGIHGTNNEGKIGWPVSHGCVRMRNKDVIELYSIVRVGTPVIIRNGPYGTFGMGFKTLLPGQSGAEVLAVQKKLKELGYYKGANNGLFTDDLRRALRQFQGDAGIPVEDRINHDDYEKLGFIEFE